MALTDIFKASSIKAENGRLSEEIRTHKERIEALQKENAALKSVFEKIGGGDALRLKAMVDELTQSAAALHAEIAVLGEQKREADVLLQARQAEVVDLDEALMLESFALYKPKFAFVNSSQYKEQLDWFRDRQKQLIKSDCAVTANEQWTVNGSAAEGRKMVADMKKLLLRSFNNECDYCVDNVKFHNIETFRERIKKAFAAAKKLGRILNAEITEDYLGLKLGELDVAHEYQEKKQEEKEELKRLREEQREQQKLEQEIKAARDKIAKEKKHFSAALKDLEAKLDQAADDVSRADLEAKIAEVRDKFHALEDEEKVVDYREQNAKAGYVYIISNVGSFGEGVYKIGMTRRLEPYDRVAELGDASVPFTFDVHAMIFSDDAPALENKMHGHFEKSRVNKINSRKEFFRANLQEIEAVLRENYDRVFDLIPEAPAEQYREGLRMASA